MVKRFLRDGERGCECPPDFPVCVCGKQPVLRALSRKPIRPSAEEIARNPRAASAKLRAAVRVQA
jgi:16S rRNA (cytosine1402-N4)-methyltransferase